MLPGVVAFRTITAGDWVLIGAEADPIRPFGAVKFNVDDAMMEPVPF